jgi:hypothetical protein
VDEVSAGSHYKRIFSGWMFAASPGLHGIEHPIYDIWLTNCEGQGALEGGAEASAQPAPARPAPAALETPPAAEPKKSRRGRGGAGATRFGAATARPANRSRAAAWNVYPCPAGRAARARPAILSGRQWH